MTNTPKNRKVMLVEVSFDRGIKCRTISKTVDV